MTLLKPKKILFSRVFPALLLVSLSVSLFSASGVLRTQAATSADDLQGQIKDLKKELEDAQKKQDKLEGNLGQINSSLNATQSVIARAQALLGQTTQTIKQKEQEITSLEEQLNLNREVLRGLIQDMYDTNGTPLVEVILSESDLNAFLQTGDNLFTAQEKVQHLITDINDMKAKIAEEKGSLEETKKSHEELLAIQNSQKQGLLAQKADVADDLEDQQAVVDKLQKEISEIQGDLNKILGKSYDAQDIKDAVDFASKKTGVPKGFLFGVLKMETNLGANVGGCTYAQVEDGAMSNYKKGKLSKRAWQTFQYRRDLFKKITGELDIDYRKQKVSCNPSGYSGTGGAMGVAQFMPDTWNGYKSAVASATGHNPPSPWNLTDGVMAMALKLDRTPGVDDGKESAMKSAACSYLGTCYAPYINGILYWAKNYKQLL